MSAKLSLKIDRFYFILGVTLLVLVLLVIFTIKGIFLAFITSRQIDENAVAPETGINKSQLDKAFETVFNKKIIPLDLVK